MFEDVAVSPETEGASSGTKPDSGSQPASEGAAASNSAETSYTPEQLKQHWGAAQNQSVQNYQWGQAEQQKRMQLEARLAEIEGRQDLDKNPDQEGTAQVQRLHKSWETDDHEAGQKVLDEVAATAAQTAKQELISEIQKSQVHQSRTNASLNVVQQNSDLWKDPNSPVTQRVSQLYQQMLQSRQSGYDYTWVTDETIPFGTPGQEIQVSPHLLRLAVEQARNEHQAPNGGTVSGAVIQSGVGFTEPSGTSQKAASPGADVTSLLDAGEIASAEMFDMTPEQFFNNLPDRNKAARKEKGAPIPTIVRD
jgi:hypothetical protein